MNLLQTLLGIGGGQSNQAHDGRGAHVQRPQQQAQPVQNTSGLTPMSQGYTTTPSLNGSGLNLAGGGLSLQSMAGLNGQGGGMQVMPQRRDTDAVLGGSQMGIQGGGQINPGYVPFQSGAGAYNLQPTSDSHWQNLSGRPQNFYNPQVQDQGFYYY